MSHPLNPCAILHVLYMQETSITRRFDADHPNPANLYFPLFCKVKYMYHQRRDTWNDITIYSRT